ncbi:MAG: hypothetical protein MZU91_05870 [Desulfosudis oleivorans]|nr:hypothetical protein [Desulfosudis oleivorans]
MFNQANFAYNSDFQGEVDFYTCDFPAGSQFRVILLQNISSELNNVGDLVEMIVPGDLQMGDNICVPRNAKFIGKIIRIEKPRIGKNASIELMFTSFVFPGEHEFDIIGRLK